jgi:hypothetical protein
MRGLPYCVLILLSPEVLPETYLLETEGQAVEGENGDYEEKATGDKVNNGTVGEDPGDNEGLREPYTGKKVSLNPTL